MHRFLLLLSLLSAGPCLADNTFIVNTVADGGGGSLRGAIMQMQASNGVQTILFQIPGNTFIQLTSPLPALVGQSIVLDGTASPGLRIEGAGWPMLKFASGSSSQSIRFDRMNLRNGSNGDGGGCVDVKSMGTLLVFDSTFDSCFSYGPAASGSGGGAIKTNGSLRLTRTLFTNNASSDGGVVNLVNSGGAVSVSGTTVLIESTRFTGNRTDATAANATTCRGGSGGALSISVPAGGSASLTDVQLVNNYTSCPSTGSRQAGTAGALAIYGQGPTSIFNLDRVYFGQNEAFQGGAISGFSVRLIVTNASFFENTGFSVGAIYMLTSTGAPATTIQLRNSSFARNSSTISSAAAHLQLQNGATISEARNTVFAQPLSGPACVPAIADVQTGATVFTSDNSCFFYLPGAAESLTAQFPGSNFGLLQATQTFGQVRSLHPPAGSVLIDNGSNSGCPTLDARGLPRPVNGGMATTCDVGAVEVNPDRLFGNGFDY
ncbi:MAG: choice-of-anchor Q domain-containing protein [Dokdonella sp.]